MILKDWRNNSRLIHLNKSLRMLCIFSKRDKAKLCFDHKTRGRNRPLVIHATLIKLNDDKSCALKCKWGLPVRAVNFTTWSRSKRYKGVRFYTCVNNLYRGWGFRSEPILKGILATPRGDTKIWGLIILPRLLEVDIWWASECKSGIQGLAIIRSKPVPRFVDVWGVKYMLIKLKLYVQMDIYRGKLIKIFFMRIACIITGEQS